MFLINDELQVRYQSDLLLTFHSKKSADLKFINAKTSLIFLNDVSLK